MLQSPRNACCAGTAWKSSNAGDGARWAPHRYSDEDDAGRSLRLRRKMIGKRGKRRGNDDLAGPRRIEYGGGGMARREPARDELGAKRGNCGFGHIDRRRHARIGEARPVEIVGQAAVRRVSRDELEPARAAAPRQRRSQAGSGTLRGRDAGYDLVGDPGRVERGDLFLRATEDQWVTGFQADDLRARYRQRDHQLVEDSPLLTVTLGLLIAILFDRVSYEAAAKALIFLPMAISSVAAGVIWKFMYDYRPPGQAQTGTLNAIVSTVGVKPQPWLIQQPWNNFALIFVGVWMMAGFAMVILSAGLKGMSEEVLEAARVDGANEWNLFWRIKVPMLNSTIAVVTTTMVIFALKAFDIVYVMTNGNFNTDVMARRMYAELFNVRDYGRASAIAVILLVAIIPIMITNIRSFQEQEATR